MFKSYGDLYTPRVTTGSQGPDKSQGNDPGSMVSLNSLPNSAATNRHEINSVDTTPATSYADLKFAQNLGDDQQSEMEINEKPESAKSKLTIPDSDAGNKGKFTGRSTLKNHFGFV